MPHTCTTHCVENLVLARGDAINVSELINRHATERKEPLSPLPVAVSKGSAPDIRQTNVNSRSILPSHFPPWFVDATTHNVWYTALHEDGRMSRRGGGEETRNHQRAPLLWEERERERGCTKLNVKLASLISLYDEYNRGPRLVRRELIRACVFATRNAYLWAGSRRAHE